MMYNVDRIHTSTSLSIKKYIILYCVSKIHILHIAKASILKVNNTSPYFKEWKILLEIHWTITQP